MMTRVLIRPSTDQQLEACCIYLSVATRPDISLVLPPFTFLHLCEGVMPIYTTCAADIIEGHYQRVNYM